MDLKTYIGEVEKVLKILKNTPSPNTLEFNASDTHTYAIDTLGMYDNCLMLFRKSFAELNTMVQNYLPVVPLQHTSDDPSVESNAYDFAERNVRLRCVDSPFYRASHVRDAQTEESQRFLKNITNDCKTHIKMDVKDLDKNLDTIIADIGTTLLDCVTLAQKNNVDFYIITQDCFWILPHGERYVIPSA
ncbi:MAG: hypothetical protein ACMXYK_04465 [Candidatus Woesearchaeota archaeon]